MDTKTLVVGQEVYMESGIYANNGHVVNVTPEGVEVYSRFTHELLRFYTDGKGWDVDGTYECGPWELMDSTPTYFHADATFPAIPEFAAILIQVTAEHPDWEASDRLKETQKRADMEAFGSGAWTPEFTAVFREGLE